MLIKKNKLNKSIIVFRNHCESKNSLKVDQNELKLFGRNQSWPVLFGLNN